MKNHSNKPTGKIRARLYEIIFEADTPSGKLFDVILIVSILLSVIAVMLDSMKGIRAEYGEKLLFAEWFFTILFSIEYLLRLTCVKKTAQYAFSFFGIVDFLATIPTYLSLILPGAQFFLVIRILRVLRVFRVLKFVQYVGEAKQLGQALQASRRKITVFLFTVITLVVILGSVMYMIEGEENGFTSIPHSIYWAIVTLTTVGYGDISPQTNLGRAVASAIMILGYAIIAVPTGIVTVELSNARDKQRKEKTCPGCSKPGHDLDSVYCKYCGTKI
ncbi:MAG: ion transporter [Bacteroidetes bacterium]|nr:ion transporter [Bacteroidota bacterium]MBU1680602.1 ion transporter [Bacteroidota bacterium]